jgi:AcrR family transcriptional regulator
MRADTLTREQIVEAAIQLLDAEGLEGLNMRALGKRLGTAATAMYWHVGSKDELITLAGDAVWGEIGLPDLATVDWRTAAMSMARDLYATLIRHPWLLQAFGSHLMYGPGKARHDDHALAVYERAGFSGIGADLAAATVLTYVLGNALGHAATAAFGRKLRRDGALGDGSMRERMDAVREIASQFPMLRARLEEPSADYGSAPEGSFEFGLRAIFEGLEARRDAAAPAHHQDAIRGTV